jgi:hypothetical protein
LIEIKNGACSSGEFFKPFRLKSGWKMLASRAFSHHPGRFFRPGILRIAMTHVTPPAESISNCLVMFLSCVHAGWTGGGPRVAPSTIAIGGALTIPAWAAAQPVADRPRRAEAVTSFDK